MAASDRLNTASNSVEMQDILVSTSIGEIGLSVRSCNALQRAGITNVEALLKVSREQLLEVKNLGVKSIDEIEKLANDIKEDPYALADTLFFENEKEPQFFFDESGTKRKDIPIDELALSYRPNRLLSEAGYTYASELLTITKKQLLAIRSMGVGSAREILTKVNGIVFEEIERDDEKKIQAEKNCMEFVSLFISYVPANYRELFQALLPHFINEQNNDIPIDKDTLFEVPILRKRIANKIVAILKDRTFGESVHKIQESFPDTLIPVNVVSTILDEMASTGIVRRGRIGSNVEIIRPTLWEYVDSIADDRQREMLKQRLQGKTLEEIAEINGSVTRERVRQINLRSAHYKKTKRIVIEEDKYQEIYKTYYFSKEDFSLAFDTDDSVYAYLTLVCDKVGGLPMEQFLDDIDYPVELRKGAERAVYKNHFTIGGVRVYKRRTELVDYVCRTYFQDEAAFSVFMEVYNTILQELNMADDSRFIVNERTYHNRLAEVENVLWKYQSRFRYYDMTGRDFSALLDGLRLEQYTDVEYSTLKFFRAYPELMEEYDLRDEYELHNLLKKLYAKKSNIHISFSRMPIVEFGEIDRDKQVIELLMHLAPIDVKGFCAAYEAEYGVLARTVAGSFVACIDKYKDHTGMYDVSAKSLPAYQIEKLKELLPDDYYDISFIMQLYCREFPAENSDMINSYTLKNMGFKVLSSYVINDKYATAAEYFKSILTTRDFLDTRHFSTKLTSQMSYISELHDLKRNREIVEYKPFRYINRRQLDRLGISAEGMNNYCDCVSAFVQPKTYFTIHSIRRKGFTHPLHKLNFDEWFYASVLSEDKERFPYLRMGGTKVFCHGAKLTTMKSIFKSILEQQNGINIYDLIRLLKDEYAISVKKYKVVEIIKASTMYYDRVMERLYYNNVSAHDVPGEEG